MYINLSPAEIERCFKRPHYIKKVDAFDSLPNEVIHLILSHVDDKTLGRCELLNKRWWWIINATGLWNYCKMRDFDHTSDPAHLFNRGLQGKRKYNTEFNVRSKASIVRKIFLMKKIDWMEEIDFDLPPCVPNWSPNSDMVLLEGKIFSRYEYFSGRKHLQSKEIMTLPADAYIHIAALSSDKQLLIAGGNQKPLSFAVDTGKVGWLSLWNGTGKLLLSWRGHESPIAFVSFLPGDNEVISVSVDKEVRPWSIRPWSIRTTAVPFSLNSSFMESIANSSYLSRTRKVDAYTFSKLQGVLLATKKGCFFQTNTHFKDFDESYYLPNNTAIMGSCLCKKKYLLWNCEGKFQEIFKQGIKLVYAPDGRSFGIKYYNIFEGAKICVKNYKGETRYYAGKCENIRNFGFSPDGQFLYYYSARVLCLIDNNTGSLLRELKGVDFIHDVKFSPDSTALVITFFDSGYYIWDLAPTEDEGVNASSQLSSCTVM